MNVLASIRARIALLVFIAVAPAFAVLRYAAGEHEAMQLRTQEENLLQIVDFEADAFGDLADMAREALGFLATEQAATSGDRLHCGQLMTRTVQFENSLHNAGVADRAGRLICSAIAPALGRPLPQYREFGGTTKSGTKWGMRVTSPLDGKAEIVFTSPIRGAGAGDPALLFASIDVDALAASMAHVHLPQGSVLRILSSTGQVLAERRQSIDGTILPALDEAARGDRGERAQHIRIGGEGYLFASHRVADAPESPLVYVAIPAAPIFSAITQLRSRGLLLLSMGLALALLLAWASATRLVLRPITRLMSFAEAIAGGNLEIRTGTAGSRGELSRLGAALDRMAESLSRVLRQNRVILDAAAEGICGLDSSGRITFLNPAARVLLGSPPESLSGASLHERLHPEADHPSERCVFLDALATRSIVRGEVEPSGQRRLRYVASPLQVPGQPDGVVVLLSDVTRQHALEEQLQQSQKMEAIGRLAGGIAHDFNNLLTVILSASSYLVEELGPQDPRTQDAKDILECGQRAAALTRQLLTFSRRNVRSTETLDVNRIAKDASSMLRRVVGEDVQFTLSLSDEPLPVNADRGQLEQVLMNLVVNARDAMPQGGKISVETRLLTVDEEALRVHPDLRPGPQAVISVSDTGTGMTEEVRKRIFDPFFTTKGPGKGTGLGLSTVFGIVEQSEGRIHVYSSPGHGSTFKVYLPLVKTTFAAKTTPDAPAPRGSGQLLLVVEDEAPVRQTVSRILTEGGYRVLSAGTPQEAIAVFTDQRSSIAGVITDVVLPQMNGVELVARLRALEPELKALYMSGYTNQAIVDQGMLAVNERFIQKPFEREHFLIQLASVLDSTA